MKIPAPGKSNQNSIYYNKQHDRFGTLWAERFKCLLVENSEYALKLVAAYIDLNPVRAGLCSDPKDYRFCGYAEAVVGMSEARRGLEAILGPRGWRVVARQYRMLLFGFGEGSDGRGKRGFDRRKSREVLRDGGKLPLHELVLCRIRFLSDGYILGSASFINRFKENFVSRSGRRPNAPPEAPVIAPVPLVFASASRSSIPDEEK